MNKKFLSAILFGALVSRLLSATERLTLSLMVKMVHKVSRVLQVRMATVLLLR